MKKIVLTACCYFIISTGFAQPVNSHPDKLQPAIFSLTMVMMHDVINPPAAARFYSYALMGAYDLIAAVDPQIPNPSSLFKTYKGLNLKPDLSKIDKDFAAVYCILDAGIALLPSGYLLEKEVQKLESDALKNGLTEARLNYSKAIAKQYVAHVLEFSKQDRYNKLSTRIRYSPKKMDGHWYPTPPAYMEAVEPNWKIIRPLMLDSAEQVKPLPPVAFSLDTTSAFHALAKEVYMVSRAATLEQKEIAGFWDCNPFAISSAGHMNVGFKKISPGAHWMNITAIACSKSNTSFSQSVFIQTVVAATLMDAFISCWEEKYRSDRIRPETYINRTIDARWQPLLQTPPFPEYTSGHSVVSGATAEVLSHFFGDQFSYQDDTEIMFELPVRSFTSFRQAAEEAAISRLYGGIHFRDAIEEGLTQGRKIGTIVVQRIKSLK